MIAMSSTSATISYAKHVATLIKQVDKAPLIIGGVHPTVAPEDTLMEDCFDMICIGEGEEALLELVESMEKGQKNTSIRNIWFKQKRQIIKNRPRPLVENLDSLPFPDFHLYDFETYLKNHKYIASFVVGRGCPHKCAYCINRYNQELYKGLGAYVRYRSADKVMEEIKSIIREFRVEGVSFCDDTFTSNPVRMKEICRKYRQQIGLPFEANARFDNITDQIMQDLADAGCVRLSLGLESGDPLIRDIVLKKRITDEQIIEASKLIKKHGIELYTFNMIGIPGETSRHIQKSIDLNRKIEPDVLTVSIFSAYKGTELYDKCKKEGILDETRPLGTYYRYSNVKHPNFSSARLGWIRRWFGFRVFISFNVKKAFAHLIDRHLLNLPGYSRVRSILITKFRCHS